jgi:hypothetical protein
MQTFAGLALRSESTRMHAGTLRADTEKPSYVD